MDTKAAKAFAEHLVRRCSSKEEALDVAKMLLIGTNTIDIFFVLRYINDPTYIPEDCPIEHRRHG